MKYTFKQIQNCNMCGAPSSNARVLGRRLNQSQGIRPQKKRGIATTIVQCRKCDLIFSNPLPIPASIDQHYGTPPESYWKPEYFESDREILRREIAVFSRLHSEPITNNSLKALDIGAGIGKSMIALSEHGFDAYGLEPSAPFHERAISKMGVSEDKLQLSSIEVAQYEPATFDFIIFSAVLEHLYDPGGAIVKALSWLKPQGIITINVPSAYYLTNKIFNLVYKIQGLDYVGNISPMHVPFHLYEFSLRSFIHHAKRNHYQIAYHEYQPTQTGLPRLLDPIFLPLMSKTSTGMQLEIWLRKLP